MVQPGFAAGRSAGPRPSGPSSKLTSRPSVQAIESPATTMMSRFGGLATATSAPPVAGATDPDTTTNPTTMLAIATPAATRRRVVTRPRARIGYSSQRYEA